MKKVSFVNRKRKKNRRRDQHQASGDQFSEQPTVRDNIKRTCVDRTTLGDDRDDLAQDYCPGNYPPSKLGHRLANGNHGKSRHGSSSFVANLAKHRTQHACLGKN